MRTYARQLLPVLFFIVNTVSAQDGNVISVSGTIRTEDGKPLSDMRIQAIYEKSMIGAYSGSGGRYSIDLPAGQTVELTVTGRSCEPCRKMVVTNGSEPGMQIDFMVKEAIDAILPGSLSQVQLYLSKSQQESIEGYILTQEKADLTSFIESVTDNPWSRSWAHAFAGHLLYRLHREEEAADQFKKHNGATYANMRGEKAFVEGRFNESLAWLKKGEPGLERATLLMNLAEQFAKGNDPDSRNQCFELAWIDYETILKNNFSPWDENLNNIFTDLFNSDWAENNLNAVRAPELDKLLDLSAHYCLQLEKRSVYYYCYENKTDSIAVSAKLYKGVRDPVRFNKYYTVLRPEIADGFSMAKLTCRYDIQLVQDERGYIDEVRRPGKRYINRKYPNKYLESYEIQKAHFSPNTIVGPHVQKYYHYRIIGRDKIFGVDAMVIEAIPLRIGIKPLHAGKVWVSASDGSVLKIERIFQEVENRKFLKRRALMLDLTPRLILVSEYGFEKNGFRYLSRNHLQEKYIGKNGERLIRLDIESIYKDYRFFDVGSRYTIKEEQN